MLILAFIFDKPGIIALFGGLSNFGEMYWISMQGMFGEILLVLLITTPVVFIIPKEYR